MDTVKVAQKRYTTKAFDANKKITPDILNELLEVIRLSPSSVNSQPWHFFIADTQEAKEKIAESMPGTYAYNAEKVLKASHTIVFCTRTNIDDDYLNLLLEEDDAAGRVKDEKAKKTLAETRAGYVDYYRNTRKNLPEWMKNQTYIALGQLLFAASAKGVDTTAMEGFDYHKLDDLLGLKDKALTSSVVVSLGYHSEDDFNAKLPKSRLSQEQLFTTI